MGVTELGAGGVIGVAGVSGGQPVGDIAGTTAAQAGATSAPPAAGGGGVILPGAAGRSGPPVAGASAGASGQVSVAGAAGGGATGQAGGGVAGSAGTAGTASGYAPCPAAGEPCRILPLGDSITFGIGYDGGYRVELFRRAHADGKNITFTGSLSNGPSMVDGVPFPRKNEGHSGWKIDQLEPLIPTPALQELPHIVLLMIGTNDVAQNDDLPNATKRLDSLLDRIVMNAPDALIVVATITPLSRGGQAVQAYNAAIPAVIDARADAGEHVLLVDMFKDFPTTELGDGVHPNRQGYERMARVWYEAISSTLR
jgi:lysophospholipase L1-like esterase